MDAVLWKNKSIALEEQEHWFGRTRALLWKNKSIALEEQEHGLSQNDSLVNVGMRRAALLEGEKFTH